MVSQDLLIVQELGVLPSGLEIFKEYVFPASKGELHHVNKVLSARDDQLEAALNAVIIQLNSITPVRPVASPQHFAPKAHAFATFISHMNGRGEVRPQQCKFQPCKPYILTKMYLRC